jgi:hypothetical protein
MGYLLTLFAGTQRSIDVLIRYSPAVAQSIVSSILRFPTRGNYNVTINGFNFGTVNRGRDAAASAANVRVFFYSSLYGTGILLPTTNVRRVNARQIVALVPADGGGGGNVYIRVVVAGITGDSAAAIFSFDAPTITEVYSVTVFQNPIAPICTLVNNEYYDNVANVTLSNVTNVCTTVTELSTVRIPVADPRIYVPVAGAVALYGGFTNQTPHTVYGPTKASYSYITIMGTNFGTYLSTVTCALMSWSNRGATVRSPRCNQLEDFYGEGEILASSIVSWTHEKVVFAVPQGSGLKEIDVSVRGQTINLGRTSPLRPMFQYSAPQIQARFPLLVDTNGGPEVTLIGFNFGPTLIDTVNAPVLTTTPITPSNWNDAAFEFPFAQNAATPIVPTSVVVIDFGNRCVSSAKLLNGQPHPLVSSCLHLVNSVTHNTIKFIAPPGVGLNRPVSVSIIDGAGVVTSSKVNISYLAPVITRMSPSIILIDDGAGAPTTTTIVGHQFGPELPDASSPAFLAVSVVLSSQEPPSRLLDANNVLCQTVQRLPDGPPPLLENNLLCGVNAKTTTVGRKTVQVTIAGQQGFAPGLSIPSRGLLIGCKQGYYGNPNITGAQTCTACPSIGAFCRGFDGVTHNMPQAYPGFYNLGALSASSGVNCPITTAPGNICIVPCFNPDACLGSSPSGANTCAPGYTDGSTGLCASCASGFFRNGGMCTICPAGGQAILVFYAIFCLAVIAGAYVLQQKSIMIGSASIGILFMQVIAMLSYSAVAWPTMLKQLFLVLSAAFLDVQVVTPDCYIPNVTFRSEFIGILLLPIAVFAILLLLHVFVLAYKVISLRPKKTWNSHLPVMVSTSLTMMFFLYIYETRTTLEVFNCRALPGLPGSSGKFLAVTGEPCGFTSIAPYVAAAIAGLVVYVAGYFIFNAIFLYRNAEKMMEDQLLRAKGVGDDRLTNPNAFTLRQTYGRMYYQFKPDYFWWQLIVLLRLFFIAFVPVIFNSSGTYQMAVCALVLMIAYGLQTTFNPYLCGANREAVLRLHSVQVFTSAVHARLEANIKSIETRGRKKVHKNVLDFNGKVDHKALLGALTGFLGDYNTLEAVLLFCAFFVALMGTIYDGDLVNAYPQTHNAVTALIILVVVVALAYWVAVLSTELYTWLTMKQREESLMKRAASKRGSKKSLDFDDEISASPSSKSLRKMTPDKQFNAGSVEAAVNPLFTSANTMPAAFASSPSATLDVAQVQELVNAMQNFDQPPPQETWSILQSAIAEMAAQSIATASKAQQLESELKDVKAQALRGDGGQQKSTFAPTAATTASDSLSAYKSSRRL